MTDYTFELTEDNHLRFTLREMDRLDVYTSTERVTMGSDARVIRATLDDLPQGARSVTFEQGKSRAEMHQLGATIHTHYANPTDEATS